MNQNKIAEGITSALTEMGKGTGDGYDAATEILHGLLADLGGTDRKTGNDLYDLLGKPQADQEFNGMKLGDQVKIDPGMRHLLVHYRVAAGELTAVVRTGNDPYDLMGTVKAGNAKSSIPILCLRKV